MYLTHLATGRARVVGWGWSRGYGVWGLAFIVGTMPRRGRTAAPPLAGTPLDIARRRRKKPGERFLHLLGGPTSTQRRSDDGENGPIAEEGRR